MRERVLREPRVTAGLSWGRSLQELPWAQREWEVDMEGIRQEHRGKPLMMRFWGLWAHATEPLVSVAGVPCLGLDEPLLT